MLTLAFLQAALSNQPSLECQCCDNLNLYDSPALERLATQAVMGRHLRIVGIEEGQPALRVVLCEDDYPGWVAVEDLDLLTVAEQAYRPVLLTAAEIRDRIPNVLAFVHAAMAQPNHYLWGGTVGPNYDCSGLMQTAFAATGIWIPRDAYQQEAFVQPVAMTALQPGDLIFFGSLERCTHVGIYRGNGEYIHSSGKNQGRNGIGVDVLSEQGDRISQIYFRQVRGAGRVVACYCPMDAAKADSSG